jgi:hypothetical protein
MKLPYDTDAVLPFGRFTVSVADEAAQRQQVTAWLEAEHFLGSFRPVGHSLAQVILEDGQPVALVQWAACAYRLKNREAWFGRDAQACARQRNLIINNVRLLVRAACRRPNLASKALTEALKAIGEQWRRRFGYEPLLAETFTDPESQADTCYKAAGWTPLGLTEGNSRQRAEFYVPNERPKKLWVKPLRPDARGRLCAASSVCAAAAAARARKSPATKPSATCSRAWISRPSGACSPHGWASTAAPCPRTSPSASSSTNASVS